MSRRAPDVVVVGAGVMGVWTALELRRSGRDVLLLDVDQPGHWRATSGDHTRILRSSHGSDAFYPRWAREARSAWIALGDAAGTPLFVQAGALWLARRGDGFEAASEAVLRSLDIPVEHLGPDETAHRWPQLRTDELAFTLFEPEGGLLLARRGVETVAEAFAAAGGRFEIAGALPPGAGATARSSLGRIVTTDGRRIAAGGFVFAAGPWLPGLFPRLIGPRITVTRQTVHYLGAPHADDRWSAPAFPSWVDYETSFYGIGALEGWGVKVGTDAYGPPFDPDRGDRVVDPASLVPIRAYLRARWPDLAAAPVIDARVCQYETTADSNFLIDRHPQLEDVWIVGGGSGHGFKHGPVIGSYVRRLFDGHEPAVDGRRFGISQDRTASAGLRTAAGELPRQDAAVADASPNAPERASASISPSG